MPIESVTNLDYLIDGLRLHIGDITPATYRYADEWLRTALVMSVKALQRWWNYKYLVDTDYNVYRNQNFTYLFPEPPIIENGDEQPIILMASIITKEGSLEQNSWAVGSWRDAEISYSNIEGNRSKEGSIDRDWKLLTDILKPPMKRLAQAKKQSLKGYLGNRYENKTDF